MEFEDDVPFSRHKEQHLNRPNFNCTECDYVTPTRSTLKTHMRIHVSQKQSLQLNMAITNLRFQIGKVGEKLHECSECGKRFALENNLIIHLSVHFMHKVKPRFDCEHCSESFLTKTHLVVSSATFWNASHYVRITFSHLHFIQKHSLKFHKERGQFKCSICPKDFPNRHLLEVNDDAIKFKFFFLTKTTISSQEHTASATCKPAEFICPICQKGYIYRRTLTVKDGWKLICRSFSSFFFPSFFAFCQLHMQFHERLARKQMQVKCDYCGIYLSDSEMLSEHYTQHQNRPDYQCLKCEFIGKTSNQLKAHMRIHVSNFWPSSSIDISKMYWHFPFMIRM